MKKAAVKRVFNSLLKAYGQRHWWPAGSPFEVMVGAVLTQNTAWSNVEKAIAELKRHNKLSAKSIIDSRNDHLAAWIRSSGYFNVKAARLKSLCRWYLERGGFDALQQWNTAALRHDLLAVHGIGPETADDILLYAFERPVFVIDAYTKRLFSRLGLCEQDVGYEHLRGAFEKALGADVPLFNEYHALIVQHGKDVCRVKPRCQACVLAKGCVSAAA